MCAFPKTSFIALWGFLAVLMSVKAAGDADHASRVDRPSVFIVVGAAGETEFGQTFAESAAHWQAAASNAGASLVVVGLATNGAVSDREQLQTALGRESREGAAALWLVFIGHGTFDGKEAKFNLRGSDVSATELAEWLKSFTRPLAVINTASASAPFLAKLSRTNRVIITATRSGHEANYTRFGRFLSETIADAGADLDKDGQISLLEAFLAASRRTAEFYETEGRLATEHPLVDDNGDGLGTPPEWFRGVRAIKRAKEGALPDGVRAHQMHLLPSAGDSKLAPAARARRDELELAVAKLRELKSTLDESEYYKRLETLLVEMSRLYESAPASPTPR
ncbi:MAG: hypothetical protein QOF48_3226 [Verrucomicrobiota bacterium]|jgi:hypothetical protein